MNDNNISEILYFMPHRYPFLLIDRIVEIELGKSLTALKNVSINEPFFNGHFPGNPVMPGVLIIEALAQAVGFLALKTLSDEAGGCKVDGIFLFAGIDNARFKQPVMPGDQLMLSVKIGKSKRGIYKAQACAKVEDNIVCSADLMAAFKGK